MKNLVLRILENLKKLDKFSVWVIGFGARMALGLLVMSALLFSLVGRFGDYLTALICARGALEAAPAVFVSAVIAGLISDLVIKERAQRT